MSDMPTPEQQPEAALIERKRKAQRPILSVRKASEMAGLSEGRWRQIVLGYQSAAGHKIPVTGPAETIKRMLDATGGMSANELVELSTYRPDVAELYERNEGRGTISWNGSAAGETPTDPLDLLRRAQGQIEQAIAILERGRNDQAPEPQQGTGSQTGGGQGGGRPPIAPDTPPPNSMEKLRELDDGVTDRSRDDPKSG